MAARVLAPTRLGASTGPTRLTAPAALQPGQARQDLGLADPEPGPDLRIGPRRQREALLEVVEQAPVGGVQGQVGCGAHSPIRPARSVRKMPLGFSAGRVAMRAKVAVS